MSKSTAPVAPVDGAFDEHKAYLPYAGTSGRGGSEASREAKAREDHDGTTTARQRRALDLLGSAGPFGLTAAELSAKTGQHHGQSSGVLSVLHKEGVIARLAVSKRAGQSVYVLIDNVGGRVTAEHGGRKAKPVTAEVPSLSEAEIALIDSFRGAVQRHPVDKPMMVIRPASAQRLLALVDRLVGAR